MPRPMAYSPVGASCFASSWLKMICSIAGRAFLYAVYAYELLSPDGGEEVALGDGRRAREAFGDAVVNTIAGVVSVQGTPWGAAVQMPAAVVI